MLFRLWFGGRKLMKSILILSSVALAGGSAIKWGILNPIYNNQQTLHMQGAKPAMDKQRGDPYYRDFSDLPWLNDISKANRELPHVFPRLTSEHLQENTPESQQLSPSLRGSIKPAAITPGAPETFKEMQMANLFTRIQTELGRISEIEIPYKSYYLNKQVRQLTKEHITHDIIRSLIHESSDQQMSIRPESLSIDFQISPANAPIDEASDKRLFPILANHINDLQIQFKIYNPNFSTQYIFKSIPIASHRETHVHISLASSEIRPLIHSIIQKPTWGLFPASNHKYHVTLHDQYPTPNIRKLALDKLSLLYVNSAFLHKPYSFNNYNLPTYSDFYKIATPSIVAITKEQIKKDIEMWHGAAYAHWIKLFTDDLIYLLNALNEKNQVDSEGKDASPLDLLLTSKTNRISLYNLINLPDSTAKVLDSFFTTSSKGTNQGAEEFRYLFKSFAYTAKKIKEHMKVSIEWVTEPTLHPPMDTDGTSFPTVSFEFKQIISWKDTVDLPLKGCWTEDDKDSSKSKYEHAVDSTKCTGSNKHFFDLTGRLDQLTTILHPIESLLSGGALGFKYMNLIKDGVPFIKWDKFSFEKDEKIKHIYKADKSPLRPSIARMVDSWDKRQISPGWKAMDVTYKQDLTDFRKFFYKLYKTINEYKDRNGIALDSIWSALGSINQLKDLPHTIKDKPFHIIFHLINHLFDKRENSTKPFQTFFESLFDQPLEVESTQLFSGWSSAFVDLEDWTSTSLGTTSGTTKEYEVNKDWASKDVNKKTEDTPLSNWRYPATFKNQDMKHLIQSISTHYSLFFPKEPIFLNISSFFSDPNLKEFLSREAATTSGLIRYKDNLKTMLQNFFYSQDKNPPLFPYKNLLNWDDAKVSVTVIPVDKAIKSVLALNYNTPTYLVSSFLSWSKSRLPVLLGEWIQRDVATITVNMMSEDHVFNRITNEMGITIGSRENSVMNFTFQPNFKCAKLDKEFQDWLKSLIKQNICG